MRVYCLPCVSVLPLQYILWYGILGTILGRKLLWLKKLLRPLGQLNTLLTGIPGSSTVLAAGQPFAHSEEFVMVSVTIECHDTRIARACALGHAANSSTSVRMAQALWLLPRCIACTFDSDCMGSLCILAQG